MNKHILCGMIACVVCAVIAGCIALEVNGFLDIASVDKDLPGIPPAEESQQQPKTEPPPVPATLRLRISDFGSVGVIPDADHWGEDYSHNLRHFKKVILSDPPFIDANESAKAAEQFKRYIDLMAEYGINAVTIPFLLEFINFDLVEDGQVVYPPGSIYRQRHEAMQAYFKDLFAYAVGRGVDILLYSDMVVLTPPLKSYLLQKLGGIDTTQTAFWDVYQKGLQEIFINFPEIKGIYIRIGEAGTIYNIDGWDYASELLVKTEEAVQAMLGAFLGIAEQFNKVVIFRTWSVGVGKIGDMHTNPSTYDRVLGGIDSHNLIVSTKYCNGDFYSFMPLNRTLYTGRHRRVIEFQARREFEAFNAFPVYMGPLHRQALLTHLHKNSRIEGIWLWTQYGGPLRAGPLSLYPFYGFNLNTDLNVYATARLAQNPAADINRLTDEWIITTFGSDPELVSALNQLFFASPEIMKKGLYISQFAKKEVKALGLLPPPMLWIFEWDIVSAGNSVLSNIYYISKNRINQMIAEGREAVTGARMMKQSALQAKHKVAKNHRQYQDLLASLDYQISLFDVLADYRAYFLIYYRWIERGDTADYRAWLKNLRDFQNKEATHTATYANNLDFPAYNFSEAQAGARLARATILSRNMSLLVVLLIPLFLIPGFIFFPAGRFANTTRLILTALISPFKRSATFDSNGPAVLGLLIVIFLSIGMGLLCVTSFGAPVTCLTAGIFVLSYVALLFLFLGRRNPGAVLSILSPAMLLWYGFLLISSLRGPALLWYHFWTNEGFRLILAGLTVFLLGWNYVVLYAVAKKGFGLPGLAATALILLIQGIQLILMGAASHMATLETSLSAINDELLVLPGGLSKIMGITTHLNIPTDIPIYIVFTGVAVSLVGLAAKIIGTKMSAAK